MSAPVPEHLSIGAVSERTGLSVHTLRFYEHEGLLLEPVRRSAAGHRVFSDRDVRWLAVCDTLRSTGMPVADLRRYVDAARRGPETVGERHELLQAHEARVREQLRDLQRSLDVISAKVAVYGQEIRDGTADTSWSERACAAEAPSWAPAASAR